MELKKVWFPIVVAAMWVALSAVTLSGFASFSGTARAQAASTHAPEGRRVAAAASMHR